MTEHILRPVSNTDFVVRLAAGAVFIAAVAFASGYFGPMLLFKESGVAPIPRLLTADGGNV